MISPAVHNLSIVNHFLITLVVVCLYKVRESLLTDLVCGLALYVDPTSLYILLPVRLVDTKGVVKSLLLWISVFTILGSCSGNFEGELRNYWNIISVKDHSETIGLFWYIFVELFNQHIQFYRCLYMLFFAVLSAQICLNIKLYRDSH